MSQYRWLCVRYFFLILSWGDVPLNARCFLFSIKNKFDDIFNYIQSRLNISHFWNMPSMHSSMTKFKNIRKNFLLPFRDVSFFKHRFDFFIKSTNVTNESIHDFIKKCPASHCSKGWKVTINSFIYFVKYSMYETIDFEVDIKGYPIKHINKIGNVAFSDLWIVFFCCYIVASFRIEVFSIPRFMCHKNVLAAAALMQYINISASNGIRIGLNIPLFVLIEKDFTIPCSAATAATLFDYIAGFDAHDAPGVHKLQRTWPDIACTTRQGKKPMSGAELS